MDTPAPDALRFTDNHCHLDPVKAAEQVAEARAAGVLRLVTVGTDLAQSRSMADIAAAHDGVWATAGVHPHDAKDLDDAGFQELVGLLARPEVVAVGECGLDYHYDHSPREVQRDVFARQIAIAHQTGLPLVIHSREAWDDTFAILDAEGVPGHTVFHCFTGGPAEAARALERDCHLSFSGIVTFPSAPELREAAVLCPLDLLMVETDAPYLAPIPHRGKRNQPAWVVDVAAGVAGARGAELAEIAEASWVNAERFYALQDGRG